MLSKSLLLKVWFPDPQRHLGASKKCKLWDPASSDLLNLKHRGEVQLVVQAPQGIVIPAEVRITTLAMSGCPDSDSNVLLA